MLRRSFIMNGDTIMDNTKSKKAPSFGKLFVLKLIKALIIAALLWAAVTLAAQQFFRATASEFCVDGMGLITTIDQIYYNITDVDMPEGFEHEKQTITEVAEELFSDGAPDIGEYTGERPFQVFGQRSACAVFDAESGEPLYTPDTSAFSADEVDMLMDYKAKATSLAFGIVTPTRTTMDYLFPESGGKNTMSRFVAGYVNTPDGTHYAVRMLYTIDYAKQLGAVRLISGIALGVVALIASLIGARRALKKTDAVYSDSEAQADSRIEEIRKKSDAPLNIIIGAAEGMRMAGDERADNIIKNANILKDIITGTENEDGKDNTDN